MTPSSSSTNAITKPSLRTSPLPIWSSISKPNPKSSALASPKKPPATNPTSLQNTSRKSLALTNTSSSAPPPPTFWSSTPRTLISSSAATTSSCSSAASKNPSKALSISSPLAPPNSSHSRQFDWSRPTSFFRLRKSRPADVGNVSSSLPLRSSSRCPYNSVAQKKRRGSHICLVEAPP